MSKELKKPIRMKMRRRAQYFMAQVGPVAAWVLSVLVAFYLIKINNETVTIQAISNQNYSILTASVDGQITSLPHDVYDEVSQGEVIAVLDDTFIRAELGILQAESAVLQARIESERDRLRTETLLADQDKSLQLRRLYMDEGRAQLDALDRRMDLETAKIDLRRLQAEATRFELLNNSGAIEDAALEDLNFRIQESEKFIDETRSSLDQSIELLSEAKERLDEYLTNSEISISLDENLIIAELEAEIDVISKRRVSIETTLTKLIVRSPFQGRVSALHAYAGNGIVAGSPIVEIVEEDTDIITAWFPENSSFMPSPGDVATIKKNGNLSSINGTVDEISESILPIPVQLQKRPTIPEYGIPVRIKVDGASFPSGQKIKVAFKK